MTEQNDDFNRLIEDVKQQIEAREYLAAINNLDSLIINSNRDGYIFFLRGKTYSGLK
jgi:uncharacterized protein HemY